MTKEVNKGENTGGKSRLDEMKEIARKYGVEVADGADSGIRAIGILGGVSNEYNKKLREGITNQKPQ